MSDLNTLNQINPTGKNGCARCENIGEACGICQNENIKQEAIKQIKELRKELEWECDSVGFTQLAKEGIPNKPKLQCGEKIIIGKIAWIKYFFNIIEEDLK